jgi:urocanate hydratase
LIGSPAVLLPVLAARGVVPDLTLAPSSPPPPPRNLLRCILLSGNASELALLDELILRLHPDEPRLRRWITQAPRRLRPQALPARACAIPIRQQASLAVAINDLVARGKLQAPVVLVRGPREVEVPGPSSSSQSDASLDAMLHHAEGAIWAAFEPSAAGLHLTTALLADGSPEAASWLERLLA